MKITKIHYLIALVMSGFFLKPVMLMAMQKEALHQDNVYKKGLLLWQRDKKEEAFFIIQSEADRGHILALYDTATMYKEGIGTPKNLHKYFEYCEKAVEKGSLLARNQLGIIYELGINDGEFRIEKDEYQAINHYMLAAEKGLEISIRNLERMLNIESGDESETTSSKFTGIIYEQKQSSPSTSFISTDDSLYDGKTKQILHELDKEKQNALVQYSQRVFDEGKLIGKIEIYYQENGLDPQQILGKLQEKKEYNDITLQKVEELMKKANLL